MDTQALTPEAVSYALYWGRWFFFALVLITIFVVRLFGYLAEAKGTVG
jgi:hypothetical protein